MKSIIVILAVIVSGFVFGQSEFEVIPQFKNLFNSGGVAELVNHDNTSVYIYSNNLVEIVPVSQYIKSFEFKKYLNTTLYDVEFQITDDIAATQPDQDVADWIIVGYKESVVITDVNTNKAVILMEVYYENYSSVISNIVVFTEDAIMN